MGIIEKIEMKFKIHRALFNALVKQAIFEKGKIWN